MAKTQNITENQMFTFGKHKAHEWKISLKMQQRMRHNLLPLCFTISLHCIHSAFVFAHDDLKNN